MAESFAEKILVVLPAYNEEGKIGKVISKMPPEWVHEVVVVNDGSCDDTAKESLEAGATVIDQPRNMGVGAAISRGIRYGLDNGYPIVVVMGGDDQDNPSEIGRLLRPILFDEFDFVQGSRYMAGGATVHIPLFRRISTAFFSWLFRRLTRYPITDGTNGYRAFRTGILKNETINLNQEWLRRYELEPYLLYKAVRSGYRVTEVPVTKRYPEDRQTGYTKMIPFLSWWSILRPLLFLRMGIRR